MTNTINAAANPALANDMLKKALQEETQQELNPVITPPSDNTVELPGGYVTSTGEVVRTAEVRELNGRDEEAIAKTTNVGKALMTILQRGVVKVGDAPVTDSILDNLLSGDREALLLAIMRVTFGDTSELSAYCNGCQEVKQVEVNVLRDIKHKVLTDTLNERVFTYKGKVGDVRVQLPTGITQKELINNADKTTAELNTILLENTVLEINGSPVYSKAQVQNLGVVDRKKIIEEISERVPGPQFEDVTITCPDCEGEVTVSINLGSLFRF
jgi:hypothetical protein